MACACSHWAAPVYRCERLPELHSAAALSLSPLSAAPDSPGLGEPVPAGSVCVSDTDPVLSPLQSDLYPTVRQCVSYTDPRPAGPPVGPVRHGQTVCLGY